MLSPQFDIYEQVSKVVHGEVADIGCGTGFGTQLFARNATMVNGYELDETALKFAERTFANGKVKFYSGDITSLENPVVPFDFVTMIDVIEHIRDDLAAVRACWRILKDNGIFICSTPNRLSRYRKSEYHVREYSPDELKTLMGKAFKRVDLLDFCLQPMESDHFNPIIAMCYKE